MSHQMKEYMMYLKVKLKYESIILKLQGTRTSSFFVKVLGDYGWINVINTFLLFVFVFFI